MDEQPRNESIARHAGIPVLEIERYRSALSRRRDGSWLVTFSFDMPKELRRNLTGSFTLILPAEPRRKLKAESAGVERIRTASDNLIKALQDIRLLVEQGRTRTPEWAQANERQLKAERELLFAMS